MLVLLCSLAFADTTVSFNFVPAITPATIAKAATPIEVGNFTFQTIEGKLKCKAGPSCTVTWNGKTSRLASVANDPSKAHVELGGHKLTLLAAVGSSMSFVGLVYNESLKD
jgi:hypothetical protein